MYYEKLADAEGHLLFQRYTKENYPRYLGIPHYHSSVEIYVVASGTFPVTVGGETRVLSRGDIAFVNGHTPHFCGAASPDPECDVYVIVASVGYFNKEGVGCDSIAAFSKSNEMTDEILRFILLMHPMKDRMNHEMRLGFVNLLLGMISRACKADGIQRKEKTNLTVQIMRYIDTEYRSAIDLSSLSKKFGYEPTYISRVFNKYAGVNLHQYINQTRYIATKKMLSASPQMTVCAAAQACGFQSMKTYYRVAKMMEERE